MSLDRIFQSIKELVRAQFPNYDYQGLWEYKVAKVTQGPPVVIDAQSTTSKMPDLTGVVMRPGSCGCVSKPKIGASILIGFVNADPTKPYVHGVDPASNVDNAMLPADVGIDFCGFNNPAVARVGDTVHGGFILVSAGGTIIPPATSPGAHLCYPATPAGYSAAQTDQGNNPGSGILSLGALASPITGGFGTITSGSGKFRSG